MVWTKSLSESAGILLRICALVAAADMLVQDDGSALGFRSVCGAAVALVVMKLALPLFTSG